MVSFVQFLTPPQQGLLPLPQVQQGIIRHLQALLEPIDLFLDFSQRTLHMQSPKGEHTVTRRAGRPVGSRGP